MSNFTGTFIKSLTKIWSAWVEPAASYNTAHRQNLRLVASLCLIACLVFSSTAIMNAVFISRTMMADPLLYVLLPLSVSNFIGYLLVRRGYARTAVLLVASVITVTLYLAAIATNRSMPFFYLLVASFMLSLVFSRIVVAGFTLLQIAGLFLFVLIGRQFTPIQIFLGPVLFLTMTTIFLILFWRYVEAQEAQRREALTRSENYLRSVVDNIPDHIYIKDLDHRFLMVNKAVLQKYKMQHECEILGKTDYDTLVHATNIHIPDLIKEEDDVYATGEALINKESYDLIQTGAPNWLLITKVPLRDQQGNIIGLVGINRNITEMKLAEAQLREREQTLQRILDSMPVLFDAFDREGNLVAWNRECERVTGYQAAEIIGHPEAMRWLYPDEQYHQSALTTSRQRNHHYRNIEWELTCKDGSKRTISWSNISQEAPIPGWDSWCIGVDVTERKQAEIEKMKLALQSERLYVIGEFVRAVSHDFRTALANIQNNGYFIRRAVTTSDTTRVPERLDNIQDNISRLIQQIDNLQTMAALHNMNINPTDVNQLLRAVTASHEDRLHEQALKVVFELSEYIPLIPADGDNIQTALHNLLDNAINHSPQGGTLHLKTYHDAHSVYIGITDHGAGIDEDKVAYIFDLFYRTDEARTLRKGGMGLGLSIVKMIAEAHEGSVHVSSQPDQGTTFTLTLPIQPR